MLLALPSSAAAYVGPGPGFVVLTSFLAVLVAGVLALFAVLTWPFRAGILFLRRLGRPKPRVRRLIIVGFDGQDPEITQRLLAEGRLPNFGRLSERGGWTRLASTCPSVSPVAWSSFSTGTHPAKHGIYDFLDRDRKSYMPVLSSSRINNVERTLAVGRYRIPLRKPELKLLRGSRPFWSLLGEAGTWSTILRVPVTFPPDRFRGAQLSAMGVPDLLGSQGTFTLFSTRRSQGAIREGGRRVVLTPASASGNGGGMQQYRAVLEGPPNELLAGAPPLALPLTIDVEEDGPRARVSVGEEKRLLDVGEMSDWLPLCFPAGAGLKVRAICRIMLTEAGEHVTLYMTPLHLDPDRPAMPISHPSYYATYLSRKLGRFATLGLAEDTWALNEGVIDAPTFLEQVYAIDREREGMLLDSLRTVRRGAVVCVFDATDRVQHMFWREMEEGGAKHGGAVARLYEHNDAIVGRVMGQLGEEDVLMVISDHGFSSFRRGVNLNAWLLREGYLSLLPGRDGGSEWLRDVDWSRTRAYAVGLTGLFLNVRGREAQGIVSPEGEAAELRREIRDRLGGLMDPEAREVAIREAFDPAALYGGPYLERAPDLIIGYNAGYRASWDGATGIVSGPVFEDNTKAWSGDHCIDPRLVPGILFCNRPVRGEEPSLVDVAPSALWLFGVEPPAYMDGRVLFEEGDFGGAP